MLLHLAGWKAILKDWNIDFRDKDTEDEVFHTHGDDTLTEVIRGLVFMHGVGGNDVPLLFA